MFVGRDLGMELSSAELLASGVLSRMSYGFGNNGFMKSCKDEIYHVTMACYRLYLSTSIIFPFLSGRF